MLDLRYFERHVGAVGDRLERLAAEADQPRHEVVEAVGRAAAHEEPVDRVHVPGAAAVGGERPPLGEVDDLLGRKGGQPFFQPRDPLDSQAGLLFGLLDQGPEAVDIYE